MELKFVTFGPFGIGYARVSLNGAYPDITGEYFKERGHIGFEHSTTNA